MSTQLTTRTPKILDTTDFEEFRRFYPCGILRSVSYDELDKEAIHKFEGYSARFILPEDYKIRNFHQLLLLRNGSERVYVAHQTKSTEIANEELLYLQEVDEAGQRLGHGEVRLFFDETERNFNEKPFVGYTFTAEGFRRQGRGKTRLEIMNGLCRILWNFPLYSDVYGNTPGRNEGPWKNLVSEGKAVKLDIQPTQLRNREPVLRWKYRFNQLF